MSKASDLARSVLAAAQRYDSPDPGIESRVWAAVEQRVDAGDPGPAIADSTGSAVGSHSAGWLTPLRVLGLVGALGIGAGVVGLMRGEPEPEAPVVPVASPPVAALAEPDVEPIATPATAPVPPAPRSEPALAVEAEQPRVRKATRDVDPQDSLAAEVELVRRARAAANAGRHAEALSVLQEHHRRFPRGELARERDMSRLRAYCALGKHADAKKLAGSMLARDRSDMLRAKLAKTCAGELP